MQVCSNHNGQAVTILQHILGLSCKTFYMHCCYAVWMLIRQKGDNCLKEINLRTAKKEISRVRNNITKRVNDI